jgi:hypothetical protein
MRKPVIYSPRRRLRQIRISRAEVIQAILLFVLMMLTLAFGLYLGLHLHD